MKKKILLGTLFVLLPFIKVNAASVNVSLNCDKTVLAPKEEAKCTLDGEFDGLEEENINVENIYTEFKFTGDATIGYRYEGNPDFNHDYDILNHDLRVTAGNKNLTGKFNIGTFYINVEASQSFSASTTLSLINPRVNTKTNSINLDINPVTLRTASQIYRLDDIKVNGESLDLTKFKGTEHDVAYSCSTVDMDTVTIEATPIDKNVKIEGLVENEKLPYGIKKYIIKVITEVGTEKKYRLCFERAEIRQIEDIVINGKRLELKDGVYNYNFSIDNTTNINLEAKLKNDSLVDFVEGYGPRKIDNIDENDTILLKTTDKYGNELTYTIKFNATQTEDNKTEDNKTEDNKTEDNKTEDNKPEDNKTDKDIKNPDTGVNISLFVVLSLISVGIIGYIVLRKVNYFKKI